MKKIISILSLALLLSFSFPVSAGTGFTMLRRADGQGSSLNFATQFKIAPTVGDAFILAVGISPNNIHVTSVTGGGVTWVKASSTATQRDNEIWYGVNSNGTSSPIVVNLNATGGTYIYSLSEWSGIATTSPVDAIGSATSPSSSLMQSGSMTTTGDNELAIASERNGTNSTFISGPTNGFTNMFVGNEPMFNVAYKVVNTGTASTSWTQGSSFPYDGMIVSFKHQ